MPHPRSRIALVFVLLGVGCGTGTGGVGDGPSGSRGGTDTPPTPGAPTSTPTDDPGAPPWDRLQAPPTKPSARVVVPQAFTAPPGFTEDAAAAIAAAPSTFLADRGTIVSTATAIRRVKRMEAGLPDDAPSTDPIDALTVESEFKGTFADGLRVRSPARPAAFVDVIPLGANAVDPKLRDDLALVAFEGAWSGVTAAYGGTSSKVEEHLAIPSRDKVPEILYRLEYGSEFGRWDATEGGYLARDRFGRALFRMLDPVVVDARGTRRTGTWSFDAIGDTSLLRARLDFDGLEFPVVVDPAFDTPLWYNDDTSGSIAARAGSTAVYYSSYGCVAAFGGGGSGFSLLGDTFVQCPNFGNDAWSTFNTTPNPPGRIYAAATNAPSLPGSGYGVYMFGGFVNGATDTSDDFYRGRPEQPNWTQLTKSGTWPTKRFMHGLAWTGSRVLLFGGVTSAGVLLKDTWTWDGTSWTMACASCFPGLYGFATARRGTEASPTIYALGGHNNSTATSGVYQWTGSTWSSIVPADAPLPTTDTGLVTTAALGAVAPSARYLALAGRTPSNQIFYGTGVDANDNRLWDAWILNFSTNPPAWQRVPAPDPGVSGSNTGLPGRRESGTAVYNEDSAELLIFGGLTGSASSDVRFDARKYRGRNDTVTMTVRCNDGSDSGTTCNSTSDTFTLTASTTLTGANGQNRLQGYFLRQNADSSWSEIGGTCGTSTSPLASANGQGGATYTITCTPAFTTGVRGFAVRVRDRNYVAGGSSCANSPSAGSSTAVCNQSQMYSGSSVCTSVPTTNAQTLNCP
ncbi:MAG: hypothetical protein U0169_02885 [Polyangiaceae bacterium]